jgi:hypothetical protein
MAHIDVLAELKNLTATERLRVAEEALQLVRQELEGRQLLRTQSERTQQLTAAAAALQGDYAAADELTVFTTLDREDFRAPG